MSNSKKMLILMRTKKNYKVKKINLKRRETKICKKKVISKVSKKEKKWMKMNFNKDSKKMVLLKKKREDRNNLSMPAFCLFKFNKQSMSS